MRRTDNWIILVSSFRIPDDSLRCPLNGYNNQQGGEFDCFHGENTTKLCFEHYCPLKAT